MDSKYQVSSTHPDFKFNEYFESLDQALDTIVDMLLSLENIKNKLDKIEPKWLQWRLSSPIKFVDFIEKYLKISIKEITRKPIH